MSPETSSAGAGAPTEFYKPGGLAGKKAGTRPARPAAVLVASVLLIAGAILHIIVGVMLVLIGAEFGVSGEVKALFDILLAIKVVLAALFLVAAVGVLLMKSWARKLGLGLAIFGFFTALITQSSILELIDLMYYLILIGLLMKTDVRTAFD